MSGGVHEGGEDRDIRYLVGDVTRQDLNRLVPLTPLWCIVWVCVCGGGGWVGECDFHVCLFFR